MYPRSSSPGFYPPDEVIAAQTSRNREAVLQLLEASDCPYEVIGKQAQYCGGPAPVTIFSDDFETSDRLDVQRHGDDRPLRDRRPGGDDLQRRQAARHDGERDA